MTTTASTYISKIDTAYPQAGKNNDSQGFRDNFRNIQLSLTNINSDVENLQLTSVKTSQTSDFSHNIIKNAALQSYEIKTYTASNVSGTVTVNYRDGNYQKFELNAGTTTLNIINWAPDNLSELTVSVTPVATASVAVNGNVHTVGSLTLPAAVTTTTFFDLWTDNAGLDIYISRRGG
jgi:hypothetical protein